LAGYVLNRWFFLLRVDGYPADYCAPLNEIIGRAHFARMGMAIMLPLAAGIYLRKWSQMSWPLRLLYVSAIGLAAAVFVIFWTTRFRYW